MCDSLTSLEEVPLVEPVVDTFVADSAAEGALECVERAETFLLGGGGGGGEAAFDVGLDLTGVPERETVGDMTENDEISGFFTW